MRLPRKFIQRSSGLYVGRSLGLAFGILVCVDSSAQQWYFQPEAFLRTFYDDNIRLASEAPQASSGASVRASMAAGRATEISDIALAAEIDTRWYLDASDFDRTNANVALEASRNLERHRFNLGARFSSESTQTSEEETSGIVQVNRRRNLISVRPGWRYALTQRLDLDTRLGYNTVSYEDVGAVPLFDYSYSQAQTGFAYRFSERLDLFSNVSFDYYDASNVDRSSDTYGFAVGLDYDASQTLTIHALGGLQHSRSKFPSGEGGQESGSDETTGGQFQFKIAKKFEVANLTLQADRGLVPSGRGTLLETTALSMRLDYSLDARWKLGFDARGYRNSEPGGGTSFNNRDFINASPRISYRLTPNTNVDLSYVYRFQDRELSDQSATSNAVFLSLNYSGNRVAMGDAMPFGAR